MSIFGLMVFTFALTLTSCGDAATEEIATKEVCEESVKKECCLTEDTDTTITETITE